jgi:hypothetical protein
MRPDLPRLLCTKCNLNFYGDLKRGKVPRREFATLPERLEHMHDLYMRAMHWINTIDSQDWLMVLVAAVVLGFFMLRGFGSRSNY